MMVKTQLGCCCLRSRLASLEVSGHHRASGLTAAGRTEPPRLGCRHSADPPGRSGEWWFPLLCCGQGSFLASVPGSVAVGWNRQCLGLYACCSPVCIPGSPGVAPPACSSNTLRTLTLHTSELRRGELSGSHGCESSALLTPALHP